MPFDPKVAELFQSNTTAFLFLMSITFMRPFGLMIGFIGMAWTVGSATLLRTGIAYALAAPIMFFEGREIANFLAEAKNIEVAALTLKEFGIGMAIGVAASIPFWVVQYGGAIMDTYRGEMNGGASDPTGGDITTTSRLYLAIAFLTFAAMGGITHLASQFYKSYSHWPITKTFPKIEKSDPSIFLEIMNFITVHAFTIAAPLVFLMLAIDFITLVCGKVVKGFNGMDVSFTLKNLATAVLFPFMALILVSTLENNYFKHLNLLEQIGQVFK